MLTTHTKDWGYFLRREGEQEGLQQGLQQGAASTLATQLAHKFGELPTWTRTRLEDASQAELKGWTLRILDAESLEDVFKD